MTESNTLVLRAAVPEDDAFLYAVYASTRAAELAVVPWDDAKKAEFLRMQFDAQHTFYHEQFPNAQYDVLIQEGEPIGRLYVDRRPDELRILDIALLPQFCGRGLGGRLLRALIEEADRATTPIRLHVETFNPARRLYERLGFRQVQNDGIYILMEWNPNHVTP